MPAGTIPRTAKHESVWIDTAPVPPRPPLEGRVSCDVAIVGSGVVGLTAAKLLQEAGKQVVVVEAGRVAAGVSGQTTGKVTSQHGIAYRRLIQRFGSEEVRAHAQANQRAVGLVRSWSAGAQWVDAPNFVYTTDAARVQEFQDEADAARELGLPASFTTQTELPLDVKAAVRFDGQGHYHPRKGLARMADQVEAGGGRVFEGSRVVELTDGGETGPAKARTAEGLVEAAHLLVATHVPILDDWSFVTRMNPKREYGITADANGVRLEGMHVSADEPRRSVRPLEGPDGPLLVIVGETHPAGERTPQPHIERLQEYAHGLGAGAMRHYWSSQDYYPLDDMPLVGRYSPKARRTFAATGFRAWGLTQGTVAAQLLCDLVLGHENPLQHLYDPFSAKRLVGTTLTPRMLHSGAIIGEGLVGARLKPGEKAELGPGEGHIESRGAHKVAVCRTMDGVRHESSAACTHKGCIVAWNPLEQSWDCPCHASRFAADGKVLRGPAVEPLRPHVEDDRPKGDA